MGGKLDLEASSTPGLGDSSYLLASGAEAVIVDPQRDVRRMLDVAEGRSLRIRYVLETHVHNDYVSGALEVRAATGATIAGPAAAGYAFHFLPLEDGSELRVGDLALVALQTPGHTPEHTSYVVRAPDDADPLAVFSGGSLMVGSAGRTDLLGPELARDLVRAQFRTMRRFAAMPDPTLLLPTHGAGSFCATAPPGEARTSTIGRERGSNPALAAQDEETFAREQLSGLMAFPAYYAHMAPINRAGPHVVGDVPLPRPLGPEAVSLHMERGARLVDARDGAAYAAAHVPWSLNCPMADTFASYVGWVVPFGTPLILLADDGPARAEAAVQLFRIGFDDVPGYLDGGMDAWIASGRPTRSYPVATLDDLIGEARLGGRAILDVRQRNEWEEGHLPGSRHTFVGDLPRRIHELLGLDTVMVACATGYRAAIAASMLDAVDVPVRLVARDGVPAALRGLG